MSSRKKQKNITNYRNNDCMKSTFNDNQLNVAFESLKLDNDTNPDTDQHLLDNIDSILDNVADKRKIRTNALQILPNLLSAMCSREHLLSNRLETIFTVLSQSFKRGTSLEDKLLASNCLSIFAVLICGNDCLNILPYFEFLCSTLKDTIENETENVQLRTSYVELISLYQFLGFGDGFPILKREFLISIENLFLQIRLGGNLDQLQQSAIFSWALLLSFLLQDDHSFTVSAIDRFLTKIKSILQCDCFNIRVAAGQALALVSELIRNDSKINYVISRDLQNEVGELARESGKKLRKRDLLLQHTHFRNIEQSLIEKRYSEDRVQLGKRIIIIDSWQLRYHYDFLSRILSTKLAQHIESNELLQKILNCEDSYVEKSENNGSKIFLRKLLTKDRKQRIGMRRDAKYVGEESN